jgi:hypothetical protein
MLDLDLVGPTHDEALAREVLPTAPSRWYLSGFLAPHSAPAPAKADLEQDDELEAAERDGDEGAPAERAAALRAPFPASIGMSVLVGKDADHLDAVVYWGDYAVATVENRTEWRRTPRSGRVRLELPARTKTPKMVPVPDSGGLDFAVSVRPVAGDKGAHQGHRVVSVFVVNNRAPAGDGERDVAFAFQVELELHSPVPLVARSNVRGLQSNDGDERIADLQYRDVHEWAVGHGVATEAVLQGAACRVVRTCWIPRAEVERVEPAQLGDVELQMEELAKLADAAAARAKLGGLVTSYRTWIEQQRGARPAEPRRQEVADELLRRAGLACDRIEAGIALLAEPKVLQAFTLANKVMAVAARQRQSHQQSGEAPKWRPFQLAFVLMNLAAIAQTRSMLDRAMVDLLFFPTGGGKTEAYLGLAAFTLVHRRLHEPGHQLRGDVGADALHAAPADARPARARGDPGLRARTGAQQRVDLLGPWPFEIGLWVGHGGDAEPHGQEGRQRPRLGPGQDHRLPRQQRENPFADPPGELPVVRHEVHQNSFRRAAQKADARPSCASTARRAAAVFTRDNRPCPSSRSTSRSTERLPCFLIATVDKFASMPWVARSPGSSARSIGATPGGSTARVRRGAGREAGDGRCLPPDLVIQDELHLISGPMGTIAGLYETAHRLAR